MLRWILPFIFLFLIDWYVFQAIKTVFKSKTILYAYIVITLAVLIYLVYFFSTISRGNGQNFTTLYSMGLFILFYVPKLIIVFFLLGEDLFRLFEGVFHSFRKTNTEAFFHGRRGFISKISLGVAAIPFASIVYGIFVGRYNYKVIKQTLFYDDLPDGFDGTTITHISDIHSGSFDNPEKIDYAIELINEQNSDLVLFTGDIVNTHATEMDPWIGAFKKIHKPKLGKYSVLGNHDYGEYIKWDSEAEKEANFEAIKDLHNKIDFTLLLNQNVTLEQNNSLLKLIGVENWGKHFKKAGDLAKASERVSSSDFKILMSHDPSHWDSEVQHHKDNYHLTLSGHTHGFQFGIEIPGVIKWSPVQYVYKQWAGLYKNAGRYLYVNRGFGYHAYPGRVGIMPEITVLTLKKGKKLV